jgi:hypothetical protein
MTAGGAVVTVAGAWDRGDAGVLLGLEDDSSGREGNLSVNGVLE